MITKNNQRITFDCLLFDKSNSCVFGDDPANYDIGRAWDLLEKLEKDGYLKIVIWKDPTGKYFDQKAIEILKVLPAYTV